MKALTKQMVKVPTSIHEMAEQQKLFWDLSLIFFGKSSEPTRRLDEAVQLVEENTMTFETHQAEDEFFPAKYLLAIDTRSQIWLNDNRTARDRLDVDGRVINFREIINDIRVGRFFMKLPASFQVQGEVDMEDGVFGDSQPPKKRSKKTTKKPKKKTNEIVKNTDQLEEFKVKEGES